MVSFEVYVCLHAYDIGYCIYSLFFSSYLNDHNTNAQEKKKDARYYLLLTKKRTKEKKEFVILYNAVVGVYRTERWLSDDNSNLRNVFCSFNLKQSFVSFYHFD